MFTWSLVTVFSSYNICHSLLISYFLFNLSPSFLFLLSPFVLLLLYFFLLSHCSFSLRLLSSLCPPLAHLTSTLRRGTWMKSTVTSVTFTATDLRATLKKSGTRSAQMTSVSAHWRAVDSRPTPPTGRKMTSWFHVTYRLWRPIIRSQPGTQRCMCRVCRPTAPRLLRASAGPWMCLLCGRGQRSCRCQGRTTVWWFPTLSLLLKPPPSPPAVLHRISTPASSSWMKAAKCIWCHARRQSTAASSRPSRGLI